MLNLGRQQRVSRAVNLAISCSLAGVGWYARRKIKFRFRWSYDPIAELVWFEPKRSPFYLLASKYDKEFDNATANQGRDTHGQ